MLCRNRTRMMTPVCRRGGERIHPGPRPVDGRNIAPFPAKGHPPRPWVRGVAGWTPRGDGRGFRSSLRDHDGQRRTGRACRAGHMRSGPKREQTGADGRGFPLRAAAAGPTTPAASPPGRPPASAAPCRALPGRYNPQTHPPAEHDHPAPSPSRRLHSVPAARRARRSLVFRDRAGAWAGSRAGRTEPTGKERRTPGLARGAGVAAAGLRRGPGGHTGP